jgi:hypothetical protein
VPEEQLVYAIAVTFAASPDAGMDIGIEPEDTPSLQTASLA